MLLANVNRKGGKFLANAAKVNNANDVNKVNNVNRKAPIFRTALILSAIPILFLAFTFCMPTTLFSGAYSPVLYDKHGKLLGAMVSADGQWHFPPLSEINRKFKAAIIEAEDKRFWHHPGIDPIAIVRALALDIRRGKIVSGASTITMQTIRLSRSGKARLSGKILSRSIADKAIEAFQALRLEAGMSKNRILALYTANAPFGGNVVGMEAAVWRWFGHDSAGLSWAEAAVLAVLPNNPAIVNPGSNRRALKLKRDQLLRRLYKKNYFDESTLNLAIDEPLPGEPLPLPRLAPHLLVRLKQEQEGRERVGRGKREIDFRFDTTIDGEIQSRISLLIERRSAVFAANGIMNAACIVLDTKTGAVIAYIGNVSPTSAQNYGSDVDVITSPRSSGSTLKPFLYAAMLDCGDLLPNMLISDIPTRVGSFNPQNNTRSYLGAVPASEALARSLNIPAVRELRTFGVARFVSLLRNLGISTLFRDDDDYGLPLILGGGETNLWELSGIYSALTRTAMGGGDESEFYPPYILRARGKQPFRGVKTAPISSGAAWLTLDALTFSTRPAEEAAWQSYSSARQIAWKTGTSQGNRDAWCVGVTADHTVAVWVGNTSGEGRPELRSAVTAAPLMFEVFQTLPQSSSWIMSSAAILKTVETCAASGYAAGVDCARVNTSMAPIDAPPVPVCPYCRVIGDIGEGQSKWFVLPPAEEWYFRRWNLDYKPLPQSVQSNSPNAGTPLAFFSPEQGAQIYIPKEMDGRAGRVVFIATHREADAVIHWHLDETYLGETQTFHEMPMRPSAGMHRVTIVDNHGNTITRRFEVLGAM
ncbi:penicillin-binding protein 1C [Spirochaetia bacterium]|nr:penicillin-binding protein 1C [Spirochaetia bacterium]